MDNEYFFGTCLVCNKWKALKDGICNWCAEDSVPGSMPQFMKEFFKDKNKEPHGED
jgi:hypothetical protein